MSAIIETWAAVVPSRDILDRPAAGFPAEQLRYLEVFQRRAVTAQEFAAFTPSMAAAIRRPPTTWTRLTSAGT